MRLVSNEQKSEWGNYSDRINSFDDEKDIEAFISLTRKNEDLRFFIRNKLGKGLMSFRPHFYGKYGPDLTIVDEFQKPVADLDVERWSQWGETWPEYYKYIHFLGRKDKYLNEDRPFFMVYLNYPRTKCLVVEKETILKYPTILKKFKKKNVLDKVKEISLSEGVIFT
jgi:hypothetical protein